MMQTRYVQTVTGRIAPEEMGLTSAHEHLIWDDTCYAGSSVRNEIRMENLGALWNDLASNMENLVQRDETVSVEELGAFAKAGGRTVIDCTNYGLGGDPTCVKRISERTGVNVLLGTGAYLACSLDASMLRMDESMLYSLFMHDLLEGFGDTGVKAGFVGEVGISEAFTDTERRVLVASARAARDAGCALVVHQPGLIRKSHEILDCVKATGMPLKQTVLAHCDVFFADVNFLRSVLQRGVNIAFDTFGLQIVYMQKVAFPRDADRLAVIRTLADGGFSDAIVTGQDVCYKVQLQRFGGNGYAHFLHNVVPYARNTGFPDELMAKLLIHNPQKIFAITR